MMNNNKSLGKILKQRRVTVPLSLRGLSAESGVSPSYLARIERGERFPSARVLCKLYKPLGFKENELFMVAGYLPPRSPIEADNRQSYALRNGLDPYVNTILAQEPVEVQRDVLVILSTLKHMANGIPRQNSGSGTGGMAAKKLSCELLSTCPYFNDRKQEMSGMTEMDKEQYCQGDYTRCGRYMIARAFERELESTSPFGAVSKSPG